MHSFVLTVCVIPGYHIAITLLNPDPSQLNTSWNIQETTRSECKYYGSASHNNSVINLIEFLCPGILLPFLQHPGVANLGNFTVSSQVQLWYQLFYHHDCTMIWAC
jgi:hypothetical protein